LEYVASVVDPNWTVSRSSAVPAVSAVSMCNQNDSVAVLQPAVSATDWVSVSVWAEP